MKNAILFIALVLSVSVSAQDEKYIKAMERNIAILDTAKAVSSLQYVQNAFERIGNANQSEWLPLYYQSYSLVRIGMMQQENIRKDEYYDKAELIAKKADSVSRDNSEIYVLFSLINSMKISVDPRVRGQQLGMQASQMNARAIELDKENPRAYFLRGSGLMYTPAQFGGGKDKAIPVLETAIEKYKSFKPVSSIMPNWGEAQAKQMLEQCKKSEQDGN